MAIDDSSASGKIGSKRESGSGKHSTKWCPEVATVGYLMHLDSEEDKWGGVTETGGDSRLSHVLLCIVGDAETRLRDEPKHTHALDEIDIRHIFRPLLNWDHRVIHQIINGARSV
jgi:hypothetical protein